MGWLFLLLRMPASSLLYFRQEELLIAKNKKSLCFPKGMNYPNGINVANSCELAFKI
jgi:hypothetical protein